LSDQNWLSSFSPRIDLTLATTHTYITALFRKFGVSGRAGLTALWLGKSPT
jgi:DNA-binding CsgD family transcriptional regulator